MSNPCVFLGVQTMAYFVNRNRKKSTVVQVHTRAGGGWKALLLGAPTTIAVFYGRIRKTLTLASPNTCKFTCNYANVKSK